MDPLFGPQLLQELNRQRRLILPNDSGSLRRPTDVLFTLSKQDDDYRLMLLKLEETLSCEATPLLMCLNDRIINLARLKLSLDAQFAESIRPLDIPIWQVLAFTEPSWFIDPERLKQRSKALISSQRNRRVVTVQKRGDFWNNSQITDWASKDQSSLILLQGSYITRNLIESTAVELIEYLQEQDQHVIWLLHALPNDSNKEIAPWDGCSVLKQIAIQILRENTSFNSLNDLASMARLFQAASSVEDWFQILAATLEAIPQIYIVINLGVLCSRISDTQTWPQHFVRLFEALEKSSGAILKVALLNHCPFSKSTLTPKTPLVQVTTIPMPPGQTLSSGHNFSGIRGGHRVHLPIFKRTRELKIGDNKLEASGPQTSPVIGGVAGKSKR